MPRGIIRLVIAWLSAIAVLWVGQTAVEAGGIGGDRWAIVVGVQEYPKGTGFALLRYAEEDAQALWELLIDPDRGGYEEGRVKVFTTAGDPARQPTRGNILTALGLLEKWSQADPQHPPDTVLVYFSGHGVEQGGKSYLIPSDVDRADLANTALSLDLVREKLAMSGAKKQIIIVDACRFQTTPGKAGGEEQSVEFARALEEFAKAKGRVVLASCSSNQASYEDEERGHSAFTGILLDGLLGAADDNGDGVITLTESYQYLTRELRSWAEKRGIVQYPSLYGEITLTLPLVRCPKWAEVRITSVPDEAEVWIDGENTGHKTPHTLKVPVSAGAGRTLELELRKEGFRDLPREVILRADDQEPPRVVVSLTPMPPVLPLPDRRPLPPKPAGVTPWVAELQVDTGYQMDPRGNERWRGGLHVFLQTDMPGEIEVVVTDVFGRRYSSPDFGTPYVGPDIRRAFYNWEVVGEELRFTWGAWYEQPPPVGATYLVEVSSPSGQDRVTTSPLRGYAPWRAPTITCPANGALIAETVPEFIWEQFSSQTTGYLLEVVGPQDQNRAGGDSVWVLGTDGASLSATFNEDGTAGVPELRPGSRYRLHLGACEKAPRARADGRQEEHAYWGGRIHAFRVGAPREAPAGAAAPDQPRRADDMREGPRFVEWRAVWHHALSWDGGEGWAHLMEAHVEDPLDRVGRPSHVREMLVTDPTGRAHPAPGDGIHQYPQERGLAVMYLENLDGPPEFSGTYTFVATNHQGRSTTEYAALPVYEEGPALVVTQPLNRGVVTDVVPAFSWEPLHDPTTHVHFRVLEETADSLVPIWQTGEPGVSADKGSARYNFNGTASQPELRAGYTYLLEVSLHKHFSKHAILETRRQVRFTVGVQVGPDEER